MQAKDHTLRSVLQLRQQWVIPVYQRHYAWGAKADEQIPKFWNDIQDRAVEHLEGKPVSPHFMGAIIYSEPTGQTFGTVSKRHLVDGQQRITTFSLALFALKEVAESLGLEQPATAVQDFLINAESASMVEPERERFKLWSSSYDRPHYLSIARGGVGALREDFPDNFYKNGRLMAGRAPKMIAAYVALVQEMQSFVKEQSKEGFSEAETINAILHGFLMGFQIVVVQLEKHDDPQSIFASLNGQAKPLSSFDLIRNDIFHRASKQLEDEDALYEGNWKRLESQFWKEEVKQGRLKRPRTDHLITHTLVAERAQEINTGQVANEYRTFAREHDFETVQEEIDSLLKYADVYEALERKDSGKPEARIAEFLDIWDISSFHPLVLWIGRQAFEDEVKRAAYRHVENYVVRRDVCGLTRKNYNKVVPSLLRALQAEDGPIDALTDQMAKMEGDGSRNPTDADVTRSMVQRPVYNELGSKKLRFILREIELKMRTKNDEKVSTDNLQIEHVMPQKWSEHWPLTNGTQCKFEEPYLAGILGNEPVTLEDSELMDKRERAKHTFGNLTLVTGSLNPTLGKGPWGEKADYFSRSLLAMNRHLSDKAEWGDMSEELHSHPTWDENVIAARSQFLASKVLEIWPAKASV